jgi:serine/threonine protein kinase
MHKKNKEFTDEEAAMIMGSLLSAVDHVHRKNYVHRDLKPDNVLINEFDDLSSIKLADFGLSATNKINIHNSNDERMGTLIFMAPE